MAPLSIVILIFASNLPDISTVEADLSPPPMLLESPRPGIRTKMVAEQFQGTQVYHSLFLPTNWKQGLKHPVIVEFAGNGPYTNKFGDSCTGKVENCSLGYGISGGKDFLWICLPYISKDRQHNQLQWWGDTEATVQYAKDVLPKICDAYGGDKSAIFIAGFSRGAIGCNFIGLHDDEIARLWRGFICHSHYDGVRSWNYPSSDRKSAQTRLRRLGNRPQFISHEGSIDQTKTYLDEVYPDGNFTFCAIPFRNHTDTWVLRDVQQRTILRQWLQTVRKLNE